jgi:hypothetical protein
MLAACRRLPAEAWNVAGTGWRERRVGQPNGSSDSAEGSVCRTARAQKNGLHRWGRYLWRHCRQEASLRTGRRSVCSKRRLWQASARPKWTKCAFGADLSRAVVNASHSIIWNGDFAVRQFSDREQCADSARLGSQPLGFACLGHRYNGPAKMLAPRWRRGCRLLSPRPNVAIG